MEISYKQLNVLRGLCPKMDAVLDILSNMSNAVESDGVGWLDFSLDDNNHLSMEFTSKSDFSPAIVEEFKKVGIRQWSRQGYGSY